MRRESAGPRHAVDAGVLPQDDTPACRLVELPDGTFRWEETSMRWPEDLDFVLLHCDGRVVFGRCRAGQSLLQAIKTHIPDVGTQGLLSGVRVWFCDSFGDLPPNRLADRVVETFGYAHPTGWRGTVAVSMEERRGVIPPLTPTVCDLVGAVASFESNVPPEVPEEEGGA